MNYNGLFGGSGGGGAATNYTLTYMTAGSFTAPFACSITALLQAPGGSGASNAIAIGGNSGPWGIKTFSMAAGEILTLTPGTGGAAVTGGVAGNTGSACSIVSNIAGTIMSGTAGEGGPSAGSGALNPATVVSAITGADAWYPGLQAGAVTGGTISRTGGAAVNVTGDGTGRSPGLSASGSSAGGSVGRQPVINATVADTPLNTINYFVFGLFPLVTTGKGSDGLPGGGTVSAADPFGGGGATGNTGAAGAGRYGSGGGGGGASATSGAGGGGYIALQITKDA